MFDKFDAVLNRFEEIDRMLTDPSILSNQDKYARLMKERSDLEPIVEKYNEYKKVVTNIREALELLEDKPDPELRELAQAELDENKELKEKLENELKILMLPKDPNDEKNVIIEIRGGAGGDEAALFAADLFRMYMRYAENKGWAAEMIDCNENELGGFKEVIFILEGKGVYSKMKYESGVHRVQRIPVTESGGRIHTSTVTVAVMPEVEDVEVDINPNDLQIDTYRSSGAGGQHVNKTSSAIRITHLPTGLVVTCQDQRSQHKNKDKALRILKSRLNDMAKAEQANEVAENRRSQVGTGDRSERIRTYNFPQGRVTDHRIGLTVYQLENILEGDLDSLIEPLIAYDQAEKLAESGL
ncbi:MAG: peptide chain release factor 1 [Clostridiaceae bacterium]|nr:peptide chain release factor 1 [Clostridiaceae bacterium]